jgi:cytochrome P450
MGAALARREARLTLDEIVKRAKGIEVTGERIRRPSALNNNFDLLPVTLTRR